MFLSRPLVGGRVKVEMLISLVTLCWLFAFREYIVSFGASLCPYKLLSSCQSMGSFVLLFLGSYLPRLCDLRQHVSSRGFMGLLNEVFLAAFRVSCMSVHFCLFGQGLPCLSLGSLPAYLL